MEPLPSYEDLISLFEADTAGGAVDWPYTSVTFRAARGGYLVEVDVEPGYRIVRLRLHAAAGGVELLNLELHGVRTVAVERSVDRDLVRVDFPDDAPAPTLWLRMRPDVAVVWGYGA